MKTMLQTAGRITLVVGLLFLLGVPTLVLAQEAPAACESLVNTNLASAGSACADLDNNIACYGGDGVSGVFFDPAVADAFAEPGDQVGIANLSELITNPANLTDEVWGVAVQNVQAGLPAALSDGWLTMIPVGGTTIENAVEPDSAFVPLAEPVSVTTTVDTEMHVAAMTPPVDSPVVGTVTAGETVPADAQSDDGDWVRVVFDNQPVWVRADALDDAADLAALPVLGPDSFASMQSFFISRSTEVEPCGDAAPAFLFVQSSKDYPVDIRVSGTNIRIQGAVTFEIVGDMLQLAVLDGLAEIEPGSADSILVPGGFYSEARIEDDEQPAKRAAGKNVVIGGWSDPQPFTERQQLIFVIVLRIPTNLLKWPVVIVIIIRPSGVGNPQIEIIAGELTRRLVRQACDANLLPDPICAAFGF